MIQECVPKRDLTIILTIRSASHLVGSNSLFYETFLSKGFDWGQRLLI